MATAALDLAEVEQRLAQAIQARPTRTRTSTLNLICCAESPAEAASLAQQLAGLAQRHPGRMLLIVPVADFDPARPAGEWRARILHLGSASPEGGVCSEILQLEASGMALLSASNALAPLLLGQVPVFLWWRGESPIANPRFEDLAAISDRIFLDFQNLASEPEEYLRLAERQRAMHHRGCVSDLTWSRLARWRQLLAQAFESTAAARHLRCLSSLEFESCAGQPALNGGALLLTGWLASRLGWHPARRLSDTALEMTDANGGAVQAVFRSGTRQDAGYILGAVALRSREGLAVTVTRTGDQLRLNLQSGDGALGRSTVTYPMPTLMDALRLELDHIGPDPLCEQAVAASAAVLRTLGVENA